MKAKTIKRWYQVHKWTSLICTVFLLMLCITGLPLVFRDEIHDWQGNEPKAADVPAGTPAASLDRILAVAVAQHPAQKPQMVIWDDDRDNVINISMATPAPGGELKDFHVVAMDARTGLLLEDIKPRTDLVSRTMAAALTLHAEMFAGEAGRLFLGLMGLLFALSLVSGAIVYGPFMRTLSFGSLRLNKAWRVRWLDLHNLVGIVTLMWALVVGVTGMVNTFGDLVIKLWEVKTLTAMMAPYRNKPPLQHIGSLDVAMETARRTAPGMTPSLIALPGARYTTTRHFDVLLRGRTPLTSKLVKPVLIDAETGQLTAVRDLPWYGQAILLSQPLHFGDYGGLALKVIWALFDIAAIAVLSSGLALWILRRKTPIEERLQAVPMLTEELQTEGGRA